MRLAQYLRSQNDPNGNSQNLWVIYDTDSEYPGHAIIVAVYDEGYRGKPEVVRDCVKLPDVRISKSDYHQRVKVARERGWFVRS